MFQALAPLAAPSARSLGTESRTCGLPVERSTRPPDALAPRSPAGAAPGRDLPGVPTERALRRAAATRAPTSPAHPQDRTTISHAAPAAVSRGGPRPQGADGEDCPSLGLVTMRTGDTGAPPRPPREEPATRPRL